MSSSGSNGRDHGGSGGSSSGWDQILSQASAIGIVYQNSPPKEGTSSFSSSRTNRSDSNRYGHSSAKFKGGR
ncbi:hypothetical protein OOU_Y34scaffold01183g2 [Pyricularia oryzae Y34]|uniref:Uncharacterized protein n=1 Tax=Pyricularia oryzae (strain Y34) TaxID=1143189 RepID=A0AA97PF73_PYRO3|nr:hypothetical protein OOU_Y34scaffold01183g2 [Pyricularia oryzae Y34]KAI6365088.1 hypothetical protein MCOR25_005481 [Pyricularia grisea]